MRHAVLLGIAILIGACENPTTPRTMVVALGSPRPIVLDNWRREVFSGAINDCSGEFLAVEIKSHHVFAFTADGSGGFHFKILGNRSPFRIDRYSRSVLAQEITCVS